MLKLILNIFLVAILSFRFSTCTRTEETTEEADGTIKTVITEEWEEETRKTYGGHDGRGHGHGDTIIIMTNDNENDDHQQTQVEPDGPASIKHKTGLLNRLYNDKLTDYHYSVDPQEQVTLNNAGYKPDGNLGRVITKREHFPGCPDLVPITRLSHDACTCHGLVVTSAHVRQWITVWAWKDAGIIGYGVLEKGKCGATKAVRHLGRGSDCNHFQTSSDTERSTFLTLGYIDHVAPTFYIWDEIDSFTPEPHSRAIEEKTTQLTRVYNEKKTDYHYSVDQEEQSVLGRDGYNYDGNMGRVVPKQSDFAECPHLVPINRLSHDVCTCHGLVVTAAHVRQWITVWAWKHAGIIGYGVLEKGQCGANVAVRHLSKVPECSHVQITNDAEYNQYKRTDSTNYIDHVAPTFYVWDSNAHFEAPKCPHADKTALLTRLYNEKETDYHYSVTQQEQTTLGQAGYQFDGNMGRIVTKQTDMPECPDLVPITRLSHAQCTCHGLVVNAANVKQWIDVWAWKDAGVIGYGVLTKGKCGANVAVRHLSKVAECSHVQITNDVEYNQYKRADSTQYVDHVAPTFYIWEA
jgi:hypothetical protein